MFVSIKMPQPTPCGATSQQNMILLAAVGSARRRMLVYSDYILGSPDVAERAKLCRPIEYSMQLIYT
jgi:hypothetical protein